MFIFNIKNMELRTITLSDGRPYSVRLDRSRIFFPDEWKLFLKSLRKSNVPLFDFMINTGSRIDEAIHIRPRDFDFERNNVRLWKTKTKAKRGEKTGKPRTLSLSVEFSNRMKRLSKNVNPEDYFFHKKLQGVNQLLKRKLLGIGIDDWYNFSSHNIRKTHGMYLKALGIDIAEICTRLGHGYDTYIKHYGSADIFSEKDMRGIRDILGNLYMRQRRY